jgi:hypothetical protein
VVEGPDRQIIESATLLLLEPTPSPSSDPESFLALQKQNEIQRKCIQDLLTILTKTKPLE